MEIEIDFGSSLIITDDHLVSKPKFINTEPGIYDAKIVGIESKGKDEKIPEHVNLVLFFKLSNDAEHRDFFTIPVSRFEELGDFRKLKLIQFISSIYGSPITTGLELSMGLKAFFKNPGKLEGLSTRVQMGYSSYKLHSKFIRREGGVSVYGLVNQQDVLRTKEDGSPLEFSSHDAIEAYTISKGLPYEKFINILKYLPSTEANDMTKFDFSL